MPLKSELYKADPDYATPEGTWWCNSHGRAATHINQSGEHCCNPKLSGILLPCRAIFAPIQCESYEQIINEALRLLKRYQARYHGVDHAQKQWEETEAFIASVQQFRAQFA